MWLQFYGFSMFFSTWLVARVITRTPLFAKPAADRITDMHYWLMLPSARMVSRGVAAVLLAVAAMIYGRELTPALFEGFGPVARQPHWLLAIEVLMMMDLTSYWSHRLFHTVPFLWRFHAIHHSATKITWSTAGRLHPINDILNYAFGMIPAFLLGFPIGILISVAPALAWYAIAAHTDWNPSYGPLRRVFASPKFHRWHHTHSHEGGNKNFANLFSLWDLVFGSYYLPEGRTPEVFGLDGGRMPENFWTQLAAPFRNQPLLRDDPARDDAVAPREPARTSSAPAPLRSAS